MCKKLLIMTRSTKISTKAFALMSHLFKFGKKTGQLVSVAGATFH